MKCYRNTFTKDLLNIHKNDNLNKLDVMLQKVHILPIKRQVKNFEPLYKKLNYLKNDKYILHEGFIITIDEKDETFKECKKKNYINEDNIYNLKNIKETDNIKNIENINETNDINNRMQYVIVECMPPKGILSNDTLIYTNGKYVDHFKKIHFLILNDKNYKNYEKKIKNSFYYFKKYVNKKTYQIFNDFISFIPYSFDCFPKKKYKNIKYVKKKEIKQKNKDILLKILNNYLKPYFQKHRNKIFYHGKMFIINKFSFLVFDFDSDINVGFIDENTDIILKVDFYDHFNNVHIVPLYDTLPTTYNYDLFKDYIKPYIEKHYLNLYSIYDSFFYNGIQFKIMGIESKNVKYGKARISSNTYIYIEGSIKPTFFDVISKEAINYIKYFPLEYKDYAILNVMQNLDFESLLRLFPPIKRKNEILQESILKEMKKYRYIFKNNDFKKYSINNFNINTSILNNFIDECAVCFEKFKDLDICIKLICLHTYHWNCVKNWFKFNMTCPCCRNQLI